MINRVVPRARLEDDRARDRERIAEMPRFGLALAKKAINQAEDRMGLRDVMDATFALHHLAHAHNSLTSEDHLAGQDAKSMAKKLEVSPGWTHGSHAQRSETKPSARGARLARGERAARAAAFRRHARGLRRARRVGEEALSRRGWAVVSWPERYGGRGASLLEWLIFEEEYYRAGAPNRVTQNGIFLLAPTLFEFGTDEQKARILPKMAAAEELWAQGWSEPNAGSDLGEPQEHGRARRRRLAAQRPEDLVHPRRVLRLAVRAVPHRSARSERHRGLTYFLVPLDTPRRHGQAGRAARRRRGLRRGLPRRRVRAGRATARRAGRRLERRDGDRGLRARA